MRKKELQKIEHEKYLLRSAWHSLNLSGLSQDVDDDFKVIENYFIDNTGSMESARISLYNIRDYLGGMDIYEHEGYDECFDYFIDIIKEQTRQQERKEEEYKKMKVTLLSHTPDAIKVAFTAIRTCYSSDDQEYIWNEEFDKYKERDDDHIRLIKQILNHGHTSTLEHITFNFAVSYVSRSLLAQLTRHRIGFSYSVQSQRYVKMSSDSKHGSFEFITPPGIMSVNSMLVYDQIMEDIQKAYDKLVKMGIKPEDARYVLPNAATTNVTISFNLRAFLDFYSKRNSETHAQWEIKELAERFRKEIEIAEPWTKELF